MCQLKQDLKRRADHEAIRTSCGYYDFTHQVLEVTGNDSPGFLGQFYVGDIARMPCKKARYTTMVNDAGEIIDDVIVFRLDEYTFRISTLYIENLIAWFDAHLIPGVDVRYQDITPELCMYAVQGPRSREILNKILDTPLDETCKFFNILTCFAQGQEIDVVRGGFTGELGFELYIPPEKAQWLENLLEQAGGSDIRKITTDVIIQSIPAEKGFVLMSDIENATPFEVGMGWTVNMDHDFIGKQSLMEAKSQGGKIRLLGFSVDKCQDIKVGSKIYYQGVEVGYVTKFVYGYTIESYIGYARVEKDVSIGDEIEIVGSQGLKTKALLTQRKWYDLEDRRTKI